MDSGGLQKELLVLLCHYLRQKNPHIYERLVEYIEERSLLPKDCKSIEEALKLRFANFPKDVFLQFISTLEPDDDYPSIFRRIIPFPKKSDHLNYSLFLGKIANIHRETIYEMVTDPLSRILITGADDDMIKVFKLPELSFVDIFIGHENIIKKLSVNPLCTMLLSCSNDGTIRIWSLISGKCISTLSGFAEGPINCVKFSPCGSLVAAACEDGTVQIWTTQDAIEGKAPYRVLRSPAKASVTSLCFSPGGEILAYTSVPYNLTIVLMKTLTQTILEYHEAMIEYIQFTRVYYGAGEYAPYLLSVSNDGGSFACWHLDAGHWNLKYSIAHGKNKKRAKILRTCVDTDEHLFIISLSKGLYVYDLCTGNEVHSFVGIPECEDVVCISCSPVSSDLFFIANLGGNCSLIETKTFTMISTVKTASSVFTQAVWSGDGKNIYVAGEDGVLLCFDVYDKIMHSKNIKKGEPKAVSLYINTEFSKASNKDDDLWLCSRSGEKQTKLNRIDIRDLDLPLNILQFSYLRDCVQELYIVKSIIEHENDAPDLHEGGLENAPPEHIPITIGLPINPRGENPTLNQENETEDDSQNLLIMHSDSDNWQLDEDAYITGEMSQGEDDKFSSILSFGQSNQYIPDLWNSYFFSTRPCIYNYVPQVGDDVYLFLSVYKLVFNTFIETNDTKIKGFTKLLSSFKKLPEVNYIHGVIISSYSINQGKWVIIIIQSEMKKYRILFPFPQTHRFLILTSIFKASMNFLMNPAIKSNIVAVLPNDPEPIVYKGILSSTTQSCLEDPANSVIIKLIPEKEKISISPWDIYTINGEKLFANPQYDLDIIHKFISELEECHYFPKDLQSISPDIFKNIIRPMTVGIIKERQLFNYYRSIRSFLDDMEMLKQMTYMIYGQKSQEANDANEFCSTYERKIKKAYNQNKSSTKVQRKKKNKDTQT